MTEWKHWKPEYDGHAPDDWAEEMEAEYRRGIGMWEEASPCWCECYTYRYRAKLADDASEDVAKWSLDTLTAQCLALPQADREALIEALQKPQRDWADDVWDAANKAYLSNNSYQSGETSHEKAAAVIRSMCRPKELPKFSDMWLRDAVDSINRTSRMGRAQKLADILREALS